MFKTIALLLFLPVPLLAFFEVEGNNGKGDVQTWWTEKYTCSCFSIISQQRFADGSSKLNLGFIQFGLSYDMTKWLNVTPYYRQQWLLTNDGWKQASVFIGDGTLKGSWYRWKLSDRNRIMYFLFDSGKPVWLYRNKVKVIAPWKIGNFGFEPYVANEIFIIEDKGFFENRLEVGGAMQFNKHSTGGLYYMWRELELADGWRLNQIIGLNFFFGF